MPNDGMLTKKKKAEQVKPKPAKAVQPKPVEEPKERIASGSAHWRRCPRCNTSNHYFKKLTESNHCRSCGCEFTVDWEKEKVKEVKPKGAGK